MGVFLNDEKVVREAVVFAELDARKHHDEW